MSILKESLAVIGYITEATARSITRAKRGFLVKVLSNAVTGEMESARREKEAKDQKNADLTAGV
jgi:hypothetical protein